MRFASSNVWLALLALTSAAPTPSLQNASKISATTNLTKTVTSNLQPRTDPPAPKPGMNIYHSPSTHRVRMFGVVRLTDQLLQAYRLNYRDVAQEIAMSVYAHCQTYMNALEAQLHYGPTWTDFPAVWSSLYADDGRGISGVSIDNYGRKSTAADMDMDEFVGRLKDYWSGHGFNVTIHSVPDAFTVGDPVKRRNTGRPPKNLEDQICVAPTDLRQCFTNEVPGLPDSYSYC